MQKEEEYIQNAENTNEENLEGQLRSYIYIFVLLYPENSGYREYIVKKNVK